MTTRRSGLFGRRPVDKSEQTHGDDREEPLAEPSPPDDMLDDAGSSGNGDNQPPDGNERMSDEEPADNDVETIIAGGPYESSSEHVWHELTRLEHLIRAQLRRWREDIPYTEDDDLWGMPNVTPEDIKAYLSRTPHYKKPTFIRRSVRRKVERDWEDAERAAREIARRLEMTPREMGLDRLKRLFGLDPIHKDILLLCLFSELDVRIRRIYGYLEDDTSIPVPTVGVILDIMTPVLEAEALDEGRARALFGPNSPLIRHRLVSLVASHEQSGLSATSVQIDQRIAAYLMDGDTIDRHVARFLARDDHNLEIDNLNEIIDLLNLDELDESQVHSVKALIHWLPSRHDHGGASLLLHGSYGSERRTAAHIICGQVDRQIPLLIADVAAAQANRIDWEQAVDRCFREARLRRAAIYWMGCTRLIEDETLQGQWHYLIAKAEEFEGLTFLESERGWTPAGQFQAKPFLHLEFNTPLYPIRRNIWKKHLDANRNLDPRLVLPERRNELYDSLASSFQFTEGQILDSIAAAAAIATDRDTVRPFITTDDLFAGARLQTSHKLSDLAQRIEPRIELTKDALKLPDPNRRQFEELLNRIKFSSRLLNDFGFAKRLRLGKGLVALFTGSSGTGKTMAAEILAIELKVDVYRVDLSAVVSKFIGETEKNLNKIFTDNTNAILFFDEADSIFGKRGEVKEARDRWANMEVNYLLQRVEEYPGVVILASNLRQNIDEAFLRRIQIIVDFPFPDETSREAIWKGMLPSDEKFKLPDDEDIKRLARTFRLAGGNIKNIVIDATVRALADPANAGAEEPALTLNHLVLSTAREYQKLGKPITKDDFGPQFYDLVQSTLLKTGESNG